MSDNFCFRNVTKRYNNKVLDELNFTIKKNSITGLLGKNGAGKTTLIKAALGMVDLDEGEVTYRGKSLKVLKKSGELFGKIGFMLEPRYNGNLTLYNNLMSIMILNGFKKSESKEKIDAVLETLNLVEVKNKRINKFSYGMKQRYSLAMALIIEPEILLLDEPLVGLDPYGIELFKEKMLDLKEKKDCTILISSHQLLEIEELCTDVAVLEKGKISKYDSLSKIVYYIQKIEFKYRIERILPEVFSFGEEVWVSDDAKSIYIKNCIPDILPKITMLYPKNTILQIEKQREGIERYFYDQKITTN